VRFDVLKLLRWRAGLLILALAMIPIVLGADDFFVFFLASYLIFGMLVLGLQLLVGSAGILCLGHAAFFGIGAYCSAILTGRYGVPFIVALPVAGLVAGIGGLLMSPIIRLREVYFAMASFAFGIVITEVFAQWKPVTGGHDGFSSIPFAQIGPLVFDNSAKSYYLALLLLCIQYVLYKKVLRSPFGRALHAMRESEAGAKSAGLNLTALKIWAILIAAVSAGIAGSLYAHLNGSVSPPMFHWSRSITLLTMLVIGGVSSTPGVFAGAFVLMFLTQYLRGFSEYSALINGAILSFFVIFLPSGIGGVRPGRLFKGAKNSEKAALARVP
jgi:branched-chain amino acid transport system permease protein